jgi:hypothetical protein
MPPAESPDCDAPQASRSIPCPSDEPPAARRPLAAVDPDPGPAKLTKTSVTAASATKLRAVRIQLEAGEGSPPCVRDLAPGRRATRIGLARRVKRTDRKVRRSALGNDSRDSVTVTVVQSHEAGTGRTPDDRPPRRETTINREEGRLAQSMWTGKKEGGACWGTAPQQRWIGESLRCLSNLHSTPPSVPPANRRASRQILVDKEHPRMDAPSANPPSV